MRFSPQDYDCSNTSIYHNNANVKTKRKNNNAINLYKDGQHKHGETNDLNLTNKPS